MKESKLTPLILYCRRVLSSHKETMNLSIVCLCGGKLMNEIS